MSFSHSSLNPMAPQNDRSHPSVRPFAFIGRIRDSLTQNDGGGLTLADGDVSMVDSFWFSPTGQPGPCQTVTHRAEAEDVRMEIDLTGDDDVGDDDIVDQGMSQLFLGTESEQRLPAEKYGSVARALHDTFSRNFTSTLNCFSPTSLIQKSPQVQSIPDTIANEIHTHRGSETNPDNHNSELDQTICEPASKEPAMETLNEAGQTFQEWTTNMMKDKRFNFGSLQHAMRGMQVNTTARPGGEVIIQPEIYDLTQDKELALPLYQCGGRTYHVGMCVEFKDHSFMKILEIIEQPETEDLRFSGRRLFRSTHGKSESFLPMINRELIWVTQVSDLMSSRYVKRRLKIEFTNFRSDFSQNPETFTCRLKLSQRAEGVILAPGRAPISSEQNSIEYLQYHEADPGLRLWSNELREQWRGETVPFGAAEKSSQALEAEKETGIIDLDPERTYTFGDAFCGGGGVSCGAKQAGLRLLYANDMEPKALDTYVLNHGDVDTECSDFYDFITNEKRDHKVDIAHASPPCQTWSPAHTVNSANDDANSACVFSGVDLARVSKCRILTLEETSGLPTRHPLFFNRMILSLVEIGYSVRWAILSCDKYGVPQERKRVMILAAGPGEVLPHFADSTHGVPGSGPNILPRETIASTINHIPDDAPNHNVARGLARWRLMHRQSFSSENLAKTITCGGGEFNYHPSGKRPYTDREMAALQTFPPDYKFAGVYTRKQIGNAVPPLFAKAIYGEVVRSLRETTRRNWRGGSVSGGWGPGEGDGEAGGCRSPCERRSASGGDNVTRG